MTLIDRIYDAARKGELAEPIKIAELAECVFQDFHPRIKETYLYSETDDNISSVIKAAERMRKKRLSQYFFMVDGLEGKGIAGFAKWKERYLSMFPGRFKAVPINNPRRVNTLSEATALKIHSELQQSKFLYIVAPPFHQLRVFMTAASEAIRRENRGSLFLYNFVGDELPWDAYVSHSQGELKNTREGLISDELARIKEYQTKGDILDVRRLLIYMNDREIPKRL
jgi:hypothetical protein